MIEWFTYLLRCSDGSLYTGYARDLKKRLSRHKAGQGARYTRARLPVELVWFEKKRTKSSAMKREALIKSWAREKKLALVSKNLEKLKRA